VNKIQQKEEVHYQRHLKEPEVINQDIVFSGKKLKAEKQIKKKRRRRRKRRKRSRMFRKIVIKKKRLNFIISAMSNIQVPKLILPKLIQKEKASHLMS